MRRTKIKTPTAMALGKFGHWWWCRWGASFMSSREPTPVYVTWGEKIGDLPRAYLGNYGYQPIDTLMFDNKPIEWLGPAIPPTLTAHGTPKKVKTDD